MSQKLAEKLAKVRRNFGKLAALHALAANHAEHWHCGLIVTSRVTSRVRKRK